MVDVGDKAVTARRAVAEASVRMQPDVLATLIDAYEAEHHPMDPPDPVEAIKFRIEQLGMTRKDRSGSLARGRRSRKCLTASAGCRSA
jgi:antitoxin component HigA of HigAB toxin-antitoxin module